MPGTNESRSSSVITVTRMEAVGYQARKMDFSLVLTCRSEQNSTQASIEWVLQIKRPELETDYHQYPVTKMKDQPAVTAVAVLTAVV